MSRGGPGRGVSFLWWAGLRFGVWLESTQWRFGLDEGEVLRFSFVGEKGDRCAKLTPFVQSSTWSTTTKSRGFTSSFKLPTALKPIAHVTPSLFNAATFARVGISCGTYWWCKPWRARKAMVVAFGFGVEVEDGGV